MSCSPNPNLRRGPRRRVFLQTYPQHRSRRLSHFTMDTGRCGDDFDVITTRALRVGARLRSRSRGRRTLRGPFAALAPEPPWTSGRSDRVARQAAAHAPAEVSNDACAVRTAPAGAAGLPERV